MIQPMTHKAEPGFCDLLHLFYQYMWMSLQYGSELSYLYIIEAIVFTSFHQDHQLIHLYCGIKWCFMKFDEVDVGVVADSPILG